MYSAFETEIKIRPDDIDLNNHVHSTRYLDYVLFARFEQMRENYKMSMDEFNARGFNWVASTLQIDFKRSLKLGDTAVVRTRIAEVTAAQAVVEFWIMNKATGKLAAEGKSVYTLIALANGRPVRIPDDIIAKYSV